MAVAPCYSFFHHSQLQKLFWGLQRSGRSRPFQLQAVKARWSIEIRYGVKLEAIALMQEWVHVIGYAAGLSAGNSSLNSGAVGAPESRLELEVVFDSIADVEAFWAAIPAAQHQAWSQRARHFIVDGSPRWEIYRSCPLSAVSSTSGATSAAAAIIDAWRDQDGVLPSGRDRSHERNERWKEAQQQKALRSDSELFGIDLSGTPDLPYTDTEELRIAREAGKRIVLDWKGDPMIINPGDNMPLF